MTDKITMHAAYFEQQGSASDVLQVNQLPIPVPGRGEVRIRVILSGVNPSDIKSRTGFLGPMLFNRIIPHQDGAGIIDAVGEGIDAIRIGERVWIYEAQYGRANGTASEYIVIPANQAVQLPENVSFETGASLGIAAMTAHYCLFADGNIAGRRVLIQGGAGAVGEAAIQLAKWSGAWVAATIRNPDDEMRVRSKGSDVVINMSNQDVAEEIKKATDGRGVDRIIEVDLSSNLNIDLASIAKGGVISTYSAKKMDENFALSILNSMINNIAFRFVYVYTMPEEFKKKAIEDISNCISEGKYTPTIGLTVPLDKIWEAHEALEFHKVKGKVLVRILNDEN
ncbi:NADPH:quinone reductase [Chryseobacterium sp. PTM-20240506]|uniref:NADPH:quinone reductase n=1 Tax=unclassified Chryseobacterium TaxID=2593645 RepID=UPI002358A958|nr:MULTISPECIES: NADPH:quinone reductase [unclassified Chryseobacterium]MDC8103404.1 NADPH:quinone reductase [Chryseobacterium sp. B21-037]MDQ1802961.1 NADPH:quinone reductase [Chryseobacterium sp. CKR4-1]